MPKPSGYPLKKDSHSIPVLITARFAFVKQMAEINPAPLLLFMFLTTPALLHGLGGNVAGREQTSCPLPQWRVSVADLRWQYEKPLPALSTANGTG